MRARERRLVTIDLIVCVLIAGCQVGISRNSDGSLRVEAQMSEAALTREVQAALADPLIEGVTVDARDGYLQVEAERRRPGSNRRDNISYRLTLGVEDGHLAARISDLQLGGYEIDDSQLAAWNERIAANLERAGRESEQSELTDVTVNSDGMTLVWRVETARSRGE